jgi:hypothetical protein
VARAWVRGLGAIRRRVTALALRRTALRRAALAGRRVGLVRFRETFRVAAWRRAAGRRVDLGLALDLDLGLDLALDLVLGRRAGRLFRAIWLLPSRLVDLGC